MKSIKSKLLAISNLVQTSQCSQRQLPAINHSSLSPFSFAEIKTRVNRDNRDIIQTVLV